MSGTNDFVARIRKAAQRLDLPEEADFSTLCKCDECGCMLDTDKSSGWFWADVILNDAWDMRLLCTRCLVLYYQQGKLACDECDKPAQQCTCALTPNAGGMGGCYTCTGRYKDVIDTALQAG